MVMEEPFSREFLEKKDFNFQIEFHKNLNQLETV